MAVLELENIRNYVNGLHKLLMSLTKDSATETFTFAKLYVNESDLVVLLNAEVEDFNETGINIEPTDARDNELKVGVSVYDEETYNNAIKAISHTADLYELVASDEFDVEEVNPLDLLTHEGDDKVRVRVYRPVTEKIIVKVFKNVQKNFFVKINKKESTFKILSCAKKQQRINGKKCKI